MVPHCTSRETSDLLPLCLEVLLAVSVRKAFKLWEIIGDIEPRREPHPSRETQQGSTSRGGEKKAGEP